LVLNLKNQRKLANQQKTSRVVVFACVSGTVGGVIGQVDEPKKCKNPQDEIDGWNEWERVRAAQGPWIDDCVFSLMSLKLVLYISSNQKFKKKWKMSLNDILSKHFFGFSSLLYVKAAGLRSGWSLARFGLGGKRTWTCVL
jgi:hypothetical protein